MNYTTWLRWGAIAGIFLIPFIPFIVAQGGAFPNMFFPYITGKNFYFRIIVELAAFCYILLALREPKYRPKASWIMWSALAFVGWMAVATALSVDPVKSFWSNFERMEGFVGLLHVFAWFVITGAVLTADKLWDRFFNTSIGASVVMGLISLFQVLHLFNMAPSSQSGARADATLGNATYLAVYMLVHLFITLYLLTKRRASAGWQMFYGLALVLQAVGLYATQTRGAILGALGGVVVAAIWMAWRSRESSEKTLRRTAIGGLIAVAVIVAGFFAIKDTSFVKKSQTLSRFASISLTDRTTISRFELWGMAWQGVQEKPLQGWGQENFNYVFNKYYSPSMWDQEQWFDRAHNQFVDWFVAGGIPAGLLFLVLYLLAFIAILRTNKLSVPEQAILAGLVAAFAFNNLFVFDNLISAIFFWLLLAFAHSLVAREVPKRLVFTRPMGEHTLAIWAPVVAVVVLGTGWWFNAPGITRAQTLVNAIGATGADGKPNSPDTVLAKFKEALGPEGWPAGNQIGIQETVEQMAQISSSLNSSNPTAAGVAQINEATGNAIQALLAQRQHDARLELFYGTYLASLGQRSAAIEALNAALADSPKKQQILFQLGILQLNSGNAAGAQATFRQAFELDTDYPVARVLYAGVYYYAGQTAQGDAILTEGFGTTIVDNDQLIRIYTDTKMYSRIQAIWQKRIEADPKNVNHHLGLAQAYFQAGDKANTIATLQKISQLDPSKAGDIQQIIKQIQDGTLKPGQ
jgi:O-antigen ligase/tetratricopeptide (TPR) repeat protein